MITAENIEVAEEEETMMCLETERLFLRRFMAGDEEHLFALDNDPEVMQFINGGIETPRSVIRNEILPAFLARREDEPYFGFWVAEMREDGSFIGWFSLRPTRERVGEVALGYRLCRIAWGQGLATEGAEFLVTKGFAEWGVTRVVATTYEENMGSQRVLAKLGMQLVTRFRMSAEDLAGVDTSFIEVEDMWDGDDLLFAIEKEVWEGNKLVG